MSLTFQVEIDEESGVYVASWDDPHGGGITTQAKNFAELGTAIVEAVRCHFTDRETPKAARLHFASDPELQLV